MRVREREHCTHCTATAHMEIPRVPPTTASVVYKSVFRRNSTFWMFVIGGAVVGECFTNGVTNVVWHALNRGVTPPTDSAPHTTCQKSYEEMMQQRNQQ